MNNGHGARFHGDFDDIMPSAYALLAPREAAGVGRTSSSNRLNDLRVNAMKCLIVLVSIVLTGCGGGPYRNFLQVPLQEQYLPETPPDVVVVSYGESFFQGRFMWSNLTVVETIGEIWPTEGLNEAIYTEDARGALRVKYNAYEKLLGEFDAFADLNRLLEINRQNCDRFELSITTDPGRIVPVINALKHPMIRDSTNFAPVLQGTPLDMLKSTDSPYVLGIKYSYGIGAKVGNEQYGFRKFYRPYAKLIGILIDTETGDVVWRNFYLAFSSVGYRGDEADAENLTGPELIKSIKEINERLVRMVIDGLNGEPTPVLPFLNGLSPTADYTF